MRPFKLGVEGMMVVGSREGWGWGEGTIIEQEKITVVAYYNSMRVVTQPDTFRLSSARSGESRSYADATKQT